ncbi:hypothetical protein EDB19DRAFT_1832529 [Suillus lakei]|nr:hypothetical protein EDB19DRAFT_1832529 [Suillus lakei]
MPPQLPALRTVNPNHWRKNFKDKHYTSMVMGRTKEGSNKVLVHPSEASPKKQRKGAQPTGNTTLLAINKIKERKWLKLHTSTAGCGDEETQDGDAYKDPMFRDALEETPNQHSDKALTLFILFKCFHENNSQTGNTYHGKWHFNETSLSTTTWNLWTRKYLNNKALSIKDSHACFEVFLSNRKGWQWKVDKGLKEADLHSNQYKLYPQSGMPGCDCFFWMLLWLTLLEHSHYNSQLEPDDFVFPAISANGIVHCGEHISYDAVQAQIDEATASA